MTSRFDAAPLSPGVRIVSLLVSALLLVLPGLVLLDRDAERLGVIVLGLCWAALALTWALSPRGYALSPDALIIERRVGRRRVPLGAITGAAADEQAMRGALRLMASGGLFGYFGIFYSQRLGRFRAYVTDPDKTLLLTGTALPIVISPDEPTTFLRRLQDLQGSAATRPGARTR